MNASSFRFGRFLRQKKSKNNRLYLDYAAATPVLPEVADLMNILVRGTYGNPGAIHAEGAGAKQVVEDARLSIARTLGVRAPEVFFTASGTEANNLAIYGLIRALNESGKSFTELEIVSTQIEHPSVLEMLRHLQTVGVVVRFAPVDEVGKIELSALEQLLSQKTALVTFAYANSEIGVVQDVKRITRMVRKYNTANGTNIKTHLDAAQAPLWLPCQVHQLGVDMMTLDAGKCNGPKGVGILAKLSATEISGIVLGGGQESGLRAGTENPAGIAGAALAIVKAQEGYQDRSASVYKTSYALAEKIQKAIPTAVCNGPAFADFEKLERLPHNVHISIPGLDTEFTVIVLDTHGIAASTKSACAGAAGGASAVVQTISNDLDRATSTIRFTIDPMLKPKDMNRVVDVLQKHVVQMQNIS